MKIIQKRVRVIPATIKSLGIRNPIVVAMFYNSSLDDKLRRIGLSVPLAVNSSILPSPVGPITFFNAEGKQIPQKDQPMETAYRQIEWSWEQWDGPYNTETVTEIREVPYRRYPRKFVPPPGIELSVLNTLDGDLVLATAPFVIDTLGTEGVCHRINVLLEIFGECEVLKEDLSRIIRAPIRRLNWKFLPPGTRPWKEVEKDLENVILAQPKGNQGPLIYRLKTINDLKPDNVATGTGGFKDYIAFGFSSKNLVVLESPLMDNATYIFGNNWQTLTQLTKTDLISGGLAQHRLIHRNDWATKIKAVLN